MTRVSEQRAAARLSDKERARLTKLLASEAIVVAAYVNGSQPVTRHRPAHKVDIAIWISPRLSSGDRSKRLSQISRRIESDLGRRGLVVVELNDAPPLLVHQVVDHGDLLVENDRDVRVSLQAAAMSIYMDFEFWLDKMAEERQGSTPNR